MCKSIKLLKDSASVSGYLDLIRIWLKDTTSLIAISAKSGRIIGVAITRINSFLYKSNTYSRVQIFTGEALEAMMRLKGALVKQANIYESTGHDTYLCIYVICVHPSYKNKGIEKGLLDACSRAATNMKISLLAGIFTSNNDQSIARKMEYSILTQIPYKHWIIDNNVVFDDTEIENYSAAFMILLKT
ncbi:cuticular protein RR-2 family member 47 isoform X2 [Nasonia vitripennis]|nr:cuticular protein RR-2 family member 47 isoform X2 [Nasonia vitripennis]XP_032454230.1 cuticular protein RR-2 family member 47 isoform X2 [Nasonia vitripennis]